MSDMRAGRDYSIAGNAGAAQYSQEDWYACPVPRKRMKELMRRSDRAAFGNYALWIGLTAAGAALAWFSIGTWFAVPAFLAYGVLYASGAQSRFHECLHGTPFRTRWANEALLIALGFMSLKNPWVWRWSHARHHTDTIIVGRDPEIAFPRPPDMWGMVLNILHIKAGFGELVRTFHHCLGRLSEDEKAYVPEVDRPKVVLHARIQVFGLAAVAAWSALAGSILPLLFIGLPTFYGSWVHTALSAMQHSGLAEDIPDHRLNTRTVYMNPILRFIYSNMNYHIEHHMYPMVPFYALRELHEEIKHDCPRPYGSVLDAYGEMIPALMRQLRDPGYYVRRILPEDATPPHPVAEKMNQMMTVPA